MSKFTDHGERKIADYFRGQGIASLPATLRVVPGSAGSDAGVTEITGKGLARFALLRALASWTSTQGDSLASTGTTKTSRNASAIALGTATASGTMTHIGLNDSASGGNYWIWTEIPPVPFVNGQVVQLDAGAVAFKLGRTGGATHRLVNIMLDLLLRGQAYSWPATLGLSYFSTAPTDAGGGVEHSSGNYARIALPADMANLSGTQGPGTTVASTGTGGRISNNLRLEHPQPIANQPTIVATGVHSDTTLGDLFWWRKLAAEAQFAPVANGPAPYYDPDELSLTLA